MPTLTELLETRNLSVESDGSKTMKRLYVLEGESDPFQAAEYGPDIGDRYGDDLFVVRKESRKVKDEESCWLDVEYSTKQRTNTNVEGAASTFEIDIGTQTTHITKALAQTHYPSGVGEEEHDTGDLIGDQGDEVEGCDIYEPHETYTETHWKDADEITQEYRETLRGIVGCVNDAAFKDYDAEELLFVGVNLRRSGRDQWQCTYRFLAGENLEDHEEKDLEENMITGIAKKAWEYLWYRYGEKVVDLGSASGETHRYKGVKDVHVAQVYAKANFADLGIGTEKQDPVFGSA